MFMCLVQRRGDPGAMGHPTPSPRQHAATHACIHAEWTHDAHAHTPTHIIVCDVWRRGEERGRGSGEGGGGVDEEWVVGWWLGGGSVVVGWWLVGSWVVFSGWLDGG